MKQRRHRPEFRAEFKSALPCLAGLLFALVGNAAGSNRWGCIRDIEYARVGERELKLDLYVPRAKPRSLLIVWVHGGAWRSGSKDDMPLRKLVDDGYAIASVDYRLSTEAKFPAQIHDLKAAIRLQRCPSSNWRTAAEKIVIAGSSAGTHLAALVGGVHRPRRPRRSCGQRRFRMRPLACS